MFVSGTALDISDRPILCSDACWETGEVVVGSSDHALYVVDAEHGTQKRRLYGKRNGHKEWVSCVAYLQDGSILSGGMDSQLCLWQNGSSHSRLIEGPDPSLLVPGSVICPHRFLYPVQLELCDGWMDCLLLWNS